MRHSSARGGLLTIRAPDRASQLIQATLGSRGSPRNTCIEQRGTAAHELRRQQRQIHCWAADLGLHALPEAPDTLYTSRTVKSAGQGRRIRARMQRTSPNTFENLLTRFRDRGGQLTVRESSTIQGIPEIAEGLPVPTDHLVASGSDPASHRSSITADVLGDHHQGRRELRSPIFYRC